MYGELVIQSYLLSLGYPTSPLRHCLWAWDPGFSNDRASALVGLLLDVVTPGQYGRGKRFLACQVPPPELSCLLKTSIRSGFLQIVTKRPFIEKGIPQSCHYAGGVHSELPKLAQISRESMVTQTAP